MILERLISEFGGGGLSPPNPTLYTPLQQVSLKNFDHFCLMNNILIDNSI